MNNSASSHSSVLPVQFIELMNINPDVGRRQRGAGAAPGEHVVDMTPDVGNVPAAHGKHALWPKSGWRHPDGQRVHEASAAVVAPGMADLPAAHAVPVHTDALERPVCALYVPAAQGSHAATRSPVSYVPAAQTAHALWPVAGWRHPAGQLAHAAALVRPVCAWYLPAAQGVIVPSPWQKCPAVQAAEVHDDAPAADATARSTARMFAPSPPIPDCSPSTRFFLKRSDWPMCQPSRRGSFPHLCAEP